jgi:hypothetical protein
MIDYIGDVDQMEYGIYIPRYLCHFNKTTYRNIEHIKWWYRFMPNFKTLKEVKKIKTRIGKEHLDCTDTWFFSNNGRLAFINQCYNQTFN